MIEFRQDLTNPTPTFFSEDKKFVVSKSKFAGKETWRVEMAKRYNPKSYTKPFVPVFDPLIQVHAPEGTKYKYMGRKPRFELAIKLCEKMEA